jgi:hypothetical protein
MKKQATDKSTAMFIAQIDELNSRIDIFLRSELNHKDIRSISVVLKTIKDIIHQSVNLISDRKMIAKVKESSRSIVKSTLPALDKIKDVMERFNTIKSDLPLNNLSDLLQAQKNMNFIFGMLTSHSREIWGDEEMNSKSKGLTT